MDAYANLFESLCGIDGTVSPADFMRGRGFAQRGFASLSKASHAWD